MSHAKKVFKHCLWIYYIRQKELPLEIEPKTHYNYTTELRAPTHLNETVPEAQIQSHTHCHKQIKYWRLDSAGRV